MAKSTTDTRGALVQHTKQIEPFPLAPPFGAEPLILSSAEGSDDFFSVLETEAPFSALAKHVLWGFCVGCQCVYLSRRVPCWPVLRVSVCPKTLGMGLLDPGSGKKGFSGKILALFVMRITLLTLALLCVPWPCLQCARRPLLRCNIPTRLLGSMRRQEPWRARRGSGGKGGE